MPKRAKELTAIEVKRLTAPGTYAVGGAAGLLMQVTPTGARSWVLRFRIGDKRRDMGLGSLVDVSLARAREKAREARELIQRGIDPVQERAEAKSANLAQQRKMLTFDQAARRFLASKTREFKNEKHAAQWASTLATYASPTLGKLPVDQIELAHIVQVLDGLWTEKTETATRVRGRIEAVLSWAIVSGFRSGDNPARWKGNLDAVLPKPTKLKNVQHHKALPASELPGFMKALRKREGMVARALEFLVLTAARSGEVRGATWGEIDLEARTWTIPAERMKAGKMHTVPLPADAVTLLEALPRFEDVPLLFPSARGTALSDMGLSAMMKRMKVDAVPHGFRSTFRDWCSEFTSYPHEVCEMALAHVIPSAVERAYRRGDLLAKRRNLMRDWSRFINTPPATGEVLPIRRVKA